MKKRVYELASLLGLTNNQMLELLWNNGINVSHYTDEIDPGVELKFKNEISVNYNFVSHENNSSLEYIEIIKLFNKKNYKIEFNDDINLFIAENGFGKTTILNIIVAVLNGDKKKLQTLPFKKLILKIKGEIIEIDKKDFNDIAINEDEARKILNVIRESCPKLVYRKIYDQYMMTKEFDIFELKYLLKKYNYNMEMDIRSSYELEEMFCWIVDRKNLKRNKESKLNKTLKRIKELVKEEIVYFPTYRRIENELNDFTFIRKNIRNRFNENGDDINFGMEDVENTITELTDKLKEDAIHNYSIMNGEILDDLLNDKISSNDSSKMRYDKEIIKIIIGRIGEDKIKQLDKLKEFLLTNSEVANKIFLEYYLSKLINIYENQKPIDEKIKKYKNVCNKYLVNKEIIYDEVITEVSIVDNESKEKISFKDLSSGEKQILSLFCKLYLGVSQKMIFIIDEPELSLSIIWQKRLIDDIYESGRIALLIGTTHSPYIFKNKYRAFAKDISMFEEYVRDDK